MIDATHITNRRLGEDLDRLADECHERAYRTAVVHRSASAYGDADMTANEWLRREILLREAAKRLTHEVGR